MIISNSKRDLSKQVSVLPNICGRYMHGWCRIEMRNPYHAVL